MKNFILAIFILLCSCQSNTIPTQKKLPPYIVKRIETIYTTTLNRDTVYCRYILINLDVESSTYFNHINVIDSIGKFNINSKVNFSLNIYK
jgi:hypothetical protein